MSITNTSTVGTEVLSDVPQLRIEKMTVTTLGPDPGIDETRTTVDILPLISSDGFSRRLPNSPSCVHVHTWRRTDCAQFTIHLPVNIVVDPQ